MDSMASTLAVLSLFYVAIISTKHFWCQTSGVVCNIDRECGVAAAIIVQEVVSTHLISRSRDILLMKSMALR